MPAPRMENTNFQRIPASSKTKMPDTAISRAVPRSGSTAISAAGSMTSMNDQNTCLNLGGSARREKYAAMVIGKATFMISEGWKRGSSGRSSQRFAPPPVLPKKITATSNASPPRYIQPDQRFRMRMSTWATRPMAMIATMMKANWRRIRTRLPSVALYSTINPKPRRMTSETSRGRSMWKYSQRLLRRPRPWPMNPRCLTKSGLLKCSPPVQGHGLVT